MKAFKLILPLLNLLPDSIIRFLGKVFSDYLLSKYAELEVQGKEVLVERENKPTIFISNHLSNIDGVVLNRILKNNSAAFMAGVKLEKNPLTSFFLKSINHIPITPGSPDKSAIKSALRHLGEGGSIVIFPEGTRSRTGSLINVKKGFILLVKLAAVPVVPMALEGTEIVLPIDDNDMGGEKLHRSKIKVKFGEPFALPCKEDCPEGTDWEEMCADYAMRKIAAMLEPKYRGVYG
ncbi:MAG TPA: lysophospholipid acyltransferase family protein [Bacillota bacterium]|nr:lysophospholipid acyltransferase family protein [Bacillota bacterium]HOR85821.1 lysophospholipid acyltransferase family protein [Bacillota bacterium]HPL54266.1 lysophospholipid acyltransferase family protein [Bacillota bacterium]